MGHLIFTGMIFRTVSGITTSVLIIYAVVFLSMIILSNLAIIPFALLKRKNYEISLESGRTKEDLIKPSKLLKI